MPEYLSPGVYVEEFEIGGKPIEGVSTSTVGFLGETERGPTTPRLITSWTQFQRIYGSYFNVNGNTPFLPYAVDGFFANGGRRCFVCRITSGKAATAQLPLDGALTVKAVGEGLWGNNIAVRVGEGTFTKPDKPLFKLEVYYWKRGLPPDLSLAELKKQFPPTVAEVFDDLAVDPESADYYENRVNGISTLVEVTKEANDSGALPTGPAVLTPLAGGTQGDPITSADYTRADPGDDQPGKRKGLSAFKEIEEISLVYAPHAAGVSPDLVKKIYEHCENQRYRFAIFDSKPAQSNVAELNPRNDFETKYGAFYYPWITIVDPLTQLKKNIPPGGHVAGIYARSDVERGVHKAPANEKINGAVDLEFQITKGEQDVLNPRGVNCLRAFPGRGLRVWGARTLSSDPLWKYINVRRLFIYLQHSIDRGTQWVVFEPNNEKLWGRVKATITDFLTRVWRDGALMGTKPEEAFFVKCDRSTMTQDDLDNGRLICLIGVAVVKPAEFVIFRIAQWAGGSAVTE